MRIRIKAIFTLAALAVFLLPGIPASAQKAVTENTYKFGRTLSLINEFYVDSVNLNDLTEKAIVEMLKNLDPHSVYISAKDVKEMNEPLNGNFEGIGIQFNILRDSIIVIEPIPGGPSEKVGLRAGDRIVKIDNEKVTGISISTNGVRSRLMGMKGTKVNLEVYRKGVPGLLEFTIVRGKIPINSVDAAYMLDKETGYIKLNKFAATTYDEFTKAVDSLKRHNMKNIVIDLRSNGGGYMAAATDIADMFFRDKRLLVYLIGRKTPRQDYESSGNGSLSSDRVAILTDEGSASASEILAGAIQDWDRGIIVGRRTFGKGLVQNAFYLPDGSMIRLTIARYYTPTGRLIQAPYNEGYEKYIENYYKRYSNGELMGVDSVHHPDSLKFRTLINKRIVYGGGGITPDLFVPADTSYYTDFYKNVVRKGVLNSFALEYSDKNRKELTSAYKKFDDFKKNFNFSQADIASFISEAEKSGVKYDEAQFNTSKNEMLTLLKAIVAANLWQTNEYYEIINEDDHVIRDALKVITDKAAYNKLLGYK